MATRSVAERQVSMTEDRNSARIRLRFSFGFRVIVGSPVQGRLSPFCSLSRLRFTFLSQLAMGAM